MTNKKVFHTHTKLILPQGSDMPILICTLDVPCLDEYPLITEFYSRLSDTCADYCRGALLSSCAVLQSDPHYPLLYRLSCRVSSQDGDLTVTLRARLSDSRSRQCIAAKDHVHLWKSGKYLRVVKQKHSSPPAVSHIF